MIYQRNESEMPQIKVRWGIINIIILVRSLHPNLARIAAEYDEIVLQAQLGHMTAEQANARISKLVAKDDQGLDWIIDPVTGNWSYLNNQGKPIVSQPPEYGFASPTPKDIGSASSKDFDSRLSFHEVDESKLNPDSVLGATRRVIERENSGFWKTFIFVSSIIIVISLVIIALTV